LRFIFAGTLAGTVALAVSTASAFSVRGKIVNGTTGKPADGRVIAVNPAAGMDEEQWVDSKNGTFEFKDLDNNAPIYLLRVDHAGIPYTEPVQVTGQDHDVTVTVYETTTSWDGVRVTMPHLAAVRDHDHLIIEQLFEIDNASQPARSITGEDGFFRIYLPAETDTITSCFVTSLGVPLDREPEPTDQPNVYYIDYPIRPGVTRVGLAYQVPYTGERFELTEPVFYDLGHLSVFGVDPAMKITSPTHDLVEQEPVHGMASYTLHGVEKGGTLTLRFEGGDEHAPSMAGTGAEGGGNISVEPSQSQQFSIYLMVLLGLVMAALAFMVARDNRNPLTDAQVLRNHYDLLITRLARLDDLRATGTISQDAHKAAREALVTRLSVIALQLRSLGKTPPQPAPEAQPDAAPHAVNRSQA
jgi:hypothetical protein